MSVTTGTILFIAGIALMALSLIVLIVLSIVFRLSSKRLKKQLEKEYGPNER